ncbi:glycine-rich domain-containing protein [Leisingera sp. ANG-Vp]|uniref:glycine-rich domain-containing protein n=1 Tax=Leisingera sp. ANG-Vp TaxID=1577896 RepID=UPI00068997FB|nr:hypothetical protein [Leisingera sp. ANG-Vp]
MGNLTNPKLWARIRDYRFLTLQDGTTFHRYVEKKTGWNQRETAVAINEYLRFAYLCLISRQGAVPSPVIDEVWHLHLELTEDYWDHFCPEALGRKLHHIPKPVRHHKDPAYFETLALYEREFGVPAPGDYWPAKRERKQDALFLLAILGCFIAAEVTGLGVFVGFAVFLIFFAAFALGPRGKLDRNSSGGCGGCGGD